MLDNKWGIIQYFLLPNQTVWRRLSNQEKSCILEANQQHNIGRLDYKNPQDYGAGRLAGGENWDSTVDRATLIKGQIINEVLSDTKPEIILEIGPGSGFYTKLICEYASVKEYVAIDIGQAFLNYIEQRLENLKNKKDIRYKLICGDFLDANYKGKSDLIILLSTVHHIPNRAELFEKLSNHLMPGGKILCIEPTHYLLRVYSLIKKILFKGYLKKEYRNDRLNLSTHHFCTYAEFADIAKKNSLKITKEWYILPKKIIIARHSVLRWLSSEMVIVLEKL